jgi:hypothetical protein
MGHAAQQLSVLQTCRLQDSCTPHHRTCLRRDSPSLRSTQAVHSSKA